MCVSLGNEIPVLGIASAVLYQPSYMSIFNISRGLKKASAVMEHIYTNI